MNEKHAIEHSATASGQVRVFVLDPDPYAAAAVRSSMGELGYPCEVMATVDDAINALRSVGGGVLVADLGGRDRDLVDLLRSVRAASPRSAVIASGADIAMQVDPDTAKTINSPDVTVTMAYDDEVRLPDDAKAVIIAP